MSYIDTHYETVKSEKAGFMAGAKPDWLAETISGAGSITYQTANGGRAVLQPGTGSTGDEVKLGVDGLNISDFDALYIRNVLQHGPNAAPANVCTTGVGFEDGDASERCTHFMNAATSSDPDADDVFNYSDSGGGRDRKFPTRVYNGEAVQETEVMFDTTNGIGVHRFQNALGRLKTDIALDAASSYFANTKIQTHDTATDRSLYIYEFEVAYLRRR